MSMRSHLTAGIMIAFGAVVLTVPVVGQQESPYKAPRTAWGEPDLGGIWDVGYSFTPLERAKEHEGKAFLTDEEVAALEKKHAESRQGNSVGGRERGKRGTVADVEGAYNAVFSRSGAHERWLRTKQTSMIVDPPDGRIPPRTPEGETRYKSSLRDATDEFGPAGPADDPEQRKSDRCTGTPLPFIQGVSSGMRRIVQSPGTVSMFLEDGHLGGGFRTIPITTRPALPAQVRQYWGDARGRWEGDTLVVDVTNFSNKTNYLGAMEGLTLIERYTRAGDDLLMLRVTVDDPTTFTKPWTIEVPLTKHAEKANQIYESACHEGNYAMTSILAGARALEREKRPR